MLHEKLGLLSCKQEPNEFSSNHVVKGRERVQGSGLKIPLRYLPRISVQHVFMASVSGLENLDLRFELP